MHFYFIFIFLFTTYFSYAQSGEYKLPFDAVKTKPNQLIFDFTVPKRLERSLKKVPGERVDLFDFSISLNNVPLRVNSGRTRGNSTLNYRRKSFGIRLFEPILIDNIEVGELAINNLAMDRDYWRNRFCFLLMKKLNIFPLANEFAEVRVNDESWGVYLAIQRPEDYVAQSGIPLLVRRDKNSEFVLEYGEDTSQVLNMLRMLDSYANNIKGESLSQVYHSVIDMDAYYKWLAFNYLVLNGDYLDELFFYPDEKSGKLTIIPWDYDDIFRSEPREGWEERNKHLQNSLLFSSESKLDQVIYQNEFLYEQYLVVFEELLSVLSVETIMNTLMQVYSELLTFYREEDIISLSKYDQYGETDLELFEQHLEDYYAFLIGRHRQIGLKIRAYKN